MPRVIFAPAIQRHVACGEFDVVAHTVREALNVVFQQDTRLRNYIIDDQNLLRKHVTIFVDSNPIVDRKQMSDATKTDSEIYVVQALSGG